MGLKMRDWIAIMCFCAIGIQNSYQFVSEMRAIRNNCRREGGYCINTIPPAPPKPRVPPRPRGGRRQGGRRRPTRTRKGKKPNPRTVGAGHTRLPASARGQRPPPAPAPYNPPQTQYPQSPAYPQQQPATQRPPAQNNGWFFGSGTGTGQGMDAYMPFFMFSRKKRQASAPEPMDPADIPQRRRNQGMFEFLNAHCRKTEFDFGCRKTGGMCCQPFL